MPGESASQVSHHVKRSAIIRFAAQIILLFIVCLVALVNLTIGNGNQTLWTALLTSCLGYMMPNPKIKAVNGEVELPRRKFSSLYLKSTTPEIA